MGPDELEGVIAAIVTPFDQAQNLDLAGLHQLTNFLIDQGVHAIMTTGGTGEFPSLSRDERKQVTATVVSAAAGRVPVIAGTAACSLVLRQPSSWPPITSACRTQPCLRITGL